MADARSRCFPRLGPPGGTILGRGVRPGATTGAAGRRVRPAGPPEGLLYLLGIWNPGGSNQRGNTDDHHSPYKRFRSWINQRSLGVRPVASTPLTAVGRCDLSFELDDVRQRLDLDSSSGLLDPAQRKLDGFTALERGSKYGSRTAGATFLAQEASRVQGSLLTFVSAEQRNGQQIYGTQGGNINLQPFSLVRDLLVSPHGKPVQKLAAPSLMNDYYCDLLDINCDGIAALALGCSVYLWNTETQSLVGHLEPSPGQKPWFCRSVSSLAWSEDGRTLCVGTRQGDIQLWDVEQKTNVRFLASHLSAVRSVSWKQQLLSSGSMLGQVYHHDPRAPVPLVSHTLVQNLCSLKWSPSGHRLASGSTDGQLLIWSDDVTMLAKSHQPLVTMKQPTAVKATGWCPWMTDVIATGGGWGDGKIRIWDTNSGNCVTSVDTHSQVCALCWDEKKKDLISGHGLPHHQIIRWDWESLELSLKFQLSGHSGRVLGLALGSGGTKMFSAGADDFLLVWDC